MYQLIKICSITSDEWVHSFRPSKLCSDLSFWRDKCLNDSKTALKYVESRRCATYENKFHQIEQCQNDEIYCPNINNGTCLEDVNGCEAQFYFGNQTQCQSQKMHHCPKSNQCIWQDWVCDGFVQCLHGEDEDFDLCYERGSFAEGATVECLEAKRFGYNVRHSEWQKLLQVMKGSRRNPLTQVSWTCLGSFETKIKKFCLRYLTYPLSKNKNPSISAQKIRLVWMVHQHFVFPLMVFTEIRCLKNISINLVTLSIPKVAKNG